MAAAVATLVALLALSSSAGAVSALEEMRVGKLVMEEMRPLNLTADLSLDRIGGRLAAVTKRKDPPWRFWVVEDWDSYNALAAPGGLVFISRKYYEKLSEDEAAFVLAHEMAHLDLNHYDRQLRRMREADIGRAVLDLVIGGGAGTIWETAADVGATAYMTHYSRALEKEADLAGYEYAGKASYDAKLAVTALSKLGKEAELHPWIVNICGTHPLLSSREDRLAALGGSEPEDIVPPAPSPAHKRDLTGGLEPLDPAVPIAVRVLAPDGKRWENGWRKSFTKHLHKRLTPLGFSIAGDDLMYKPDIGDPVAAARSRRAAYLLLVTVYEMSSTSLGVGDLYTTPADAVAVVGARLMSALDGAVLWAGGLCEQRHCRDLLPVDREVLYTDACIGALAEKMAGQIALSCARAAGAKPAAQPAKPAGRAE